MRGELSEAYAAELAAAAEKSGVDESVLSGEGLMRGRRVAVVVGEFGFLAGSIGRASADRLVAAIERATREGLPLLAAPISGGTRMQEGTPAFVQMVRITEAVAAHKAAALPYLVYLRHPTTGGVMASWGSLGHVTVAEPGALVGFLGPRVYEALYDRKFPEGVQTSENLYARGIIDAVLAPDEIAEILDRALAVLLAPRVGIPSVPNPPDDPVPDVDTWDAVTRSRRPDRPGVRRLLKYAASDVVPLNGTGQGESDPGLLIALVRFGEAPCVFLGQDRRGQTADHPMGPEALREARRGMHLASELGLPLVTVIDTQGAALSPDAENGGLAGEIARCLAELVTLDAPTLCLMLGEGNGGGALALLPADRVVAAQHAWLSPLPPEGASRDRAPRPRPRPRDGARPAGAGDRPARPRHRRPDRRGEAGRRRRARGVLPADGRRAGVRARRAPRLRARVSRRPGAPLRVSRGPLVTQCYDHYPGARALCWTSEH